MPDLVGNPNCWFSHTKAQKYFIPRYSHTAHVMKDFLVLVGGVSFSHRVPGVTVIHLPSGQCAEFTLPVSFTISKTQPCTCNKQTFYTPR